MASKKENKANSIPMRGNAMIQACIIAIREYHPSLTDMQIYWRSCHTMAEDIDNLNIEIWDELSKYESTIDASNTKFPTAVRILIDDDDYTKIKRRYEEENGLKTDSAFRTTIIKFALLYYRRKLEGTYLGKDKFPLLYNYIDNVIQSKSIDSFYDDICNETERLISLLRITEPETGELAGLLPLRSWIREVNTFLGATEAVSNNLAKLNNINEEALLLYKEYNPQIFTQKEIEKKPSLFVKEYKRIHHYDYIVEATKNLLEDVISAAQVLHECFENSTKDRLDSILDIITDARNNKLTFETYKKMQTLMHIGSLYKDLFYSQVLSADYIRATEVDTAEMDSFISKYELGQLARLSKEQYIEDRKITSIPKVEFVSNRK